MKKNLKRALSLAFALALVLAMSTAVLAASSPTPVSHISPVTGKTCVNTGISYTHINTPAGGSYSSTHLMTTNDVCTIYYYSHSHSAACSGCGWSYSGTYDRNCTEQHSKCGKGTIRSCNS